MESGGEKKEEKGPITFPPRSHYCSNTLWGQYFSQYLKPKLIQAADSQNTCTHR